MKSPNKKPFEISAISNALFGVALSAVLGAGSVAAQGATGATGIDATGNAQSEMAACNNGKTQQDKETCMREVRNANAEKRAGKLDGSSTGLDANAMQRCDTFTGEDKIACQARIAGYGNTSGSVGGGGLIREVETVVVPADGTTVTVQPKTQSDNIIVIPAPQ